MSNVMLYQGTWERVVVPIRGIRVSFLWEEANVVSFGANGDGPLDLFHY